MYYALTFSRALNLIYSLYKLYFSHTFFIISIFLTICIIIFSTVFFSIDIIFINQFDVAQLRDYIISLGIYLKNRLKI